MIHEDELHLLYDLKVLPAGRMPFRRVRWELWHGPRLLATGWRTSDADAERALRTATARFAHRVLGVVPLRPQGTVVSGQWRGEGPVRLDCGVVQCTMNRRVGARMAA